MTPYLLLKSAERSKVNKVLEEHALDDETLSAAKTALEELGDDFDVLADILASEEHRGVMRPGAYHDLIRIMGGTHSCAVDWRKIPRRRR